MKSPVSSFRACFMALGLTLTLVACGGSSDPETLVREGNTELGSGNGSAALAKFDAALEAVEPTAETWMDAKLGRIEALIFVDAPRAKSEFLELARTRESDVDESKFVEFGGKMSSEKKFDQAIDVLDAGVQRFGKESAKLMAALDKVKRDATAAGASEALNKLSGLGYTN